MAGDCPELELGAPSPHVEGCPSCRQELALWLAVKALPRRRGSPSVREAVLAAAGAAPWEAPAPASSATGRDVRAQVLEAAASYGAGRPPPSLERFKKVPAAATAPGTAVLIPARRPLPLRLLLAAAFFVVVLLVAFALQERPDLDAPLPDVQPPTVTTEAPQPQPVAAPPVIAAPRLLPAAPLQFAAVICTCERADQRAVRDAYLAATPGARAVKPDDPELEAASSVFAIGGSALDAALSLPKVVPITYALVPPSYVRPGADRATERTLGPSREQVADVQRRFASAKRIGVVTSVAFATINVPPFVRIDPDLRRIKHELPELDVVWAIGLDNALLEALTRECRAADIVLLVGDEPSSDSRVAAYIRQLRGNSNVEIRERAIRALGAAASPEAVLPLCEALRDPLPRTRLAAINALEALGRKSATACLKQHHDLVLEVQQRAIEVIAALGRTERRATLTRLSGDFPAGTLLFAEQLLRESLQRWGLTLETADGGGSGLELRALIHRNGANGMKLEVTALSGGSLLGTWNVKASGGRDASLLKAVVPKVVDDLATDLDWPKPP